MSVAAVRTAIKVRNVCPVISLAIRLYLKMPE